MPGKIGRRVLTPLGIPPKADEEEGPWPGEKEWNPNPQPGFVPEVTHYDPVVIGRLYLPDGTILEYTQERTFGFERALYED